MKLERLVEYGIGINIGTYYRLMYQIDGLDSDWGVLWVSIYGVN